MQDCKSPRNDGLTNKFYEYFWNVIKDLLLMNSVEEARKKKKLNVSQRQVVIKLIEKRTDKTLHKELASNFST